MYSHFLVKTFKSYFTPMAILITIVFMIALPVRAELIQPIFAGNVKDDTYTLSASEIIELEHQLFKIENETTIPIGILLLKSLNDNKERKYALTTPSEWKRRRVLRDGILIIIGLEDNHFAAIFGEQLEATLSEETRKKLTHEALLLNLKNKKLFEGLNASLSEASDILEAISTKKQFDQFKEYWPYLLIAILVLSFEYIGDLPLFAYRQLRNKYHLGRNASIFLISIALLALFYIYDFAALLVLIAFILKMIKQFNVSSFRF